MFYRRLHLLTSCRRLLKGHKLSPQFGLHHACALDFGPPAFLSLVILRLQSDLFIYLIFQFPMSRSITLQNKIKSHEDRCKSNVLHHPFFRQKSLIKKNEKWLIKNYWEWILTGLDWRLDNITLIYKFLGCEHVFIYILEAVSYKTTILSSLTLHPANHSPRARHILHC